MAVGSGSTTFDKPMDNAGEKTFGAGQGYAQYAWQHNYEVMLPGCDAPGKVFVGQRKDPFMLPLGRIFDLINLNPLGATDGGNVDDLADYRVTTAYIEQRAGILLWDKLTGPEIEVEKNTVRNMW